jgi:hypothetical protein
MHLSDTTTNFGGKEKYLKREERRVLHVMVWIDWDFDYSDQLTRKYMKYKGEYYDVGTICKIKGRDGKPKLVKFKGWHFNDDRSNFELIDKNDGSYTLYDNYNRLGVNEYCLEIVMPVYPPKLEKIETSGGKVGLPDRDKPPSWDIEVAWIWYIVVMVVAIIFKDRWLIWGFATAIFFLWKNGFLGGKK